MRLALVAATVAACSSCAPSYYPSPEPGYYDHQSYVMLNSAAIVDVECIGGSHIGGSAVAISPRHLLTAKHVLTACRRYSQVDVWKVTVKVGLNQDEYEVILDDASEKYDVARLALVSTHEPFKVWVHVRSRHASNGEPACVVAADVLMDILVYKCGQVIAADDDGMIFLIPVVPGNSGGPLYDRSGNLIGIVTKRSMTPENWGIGVSPPAFKELF